MTNKVLFFLNSDPVVLENPSPDLMLIDFLRSPEVRLTGAKKGCGQGGCGSCTVILSRWNEDRQAADHRAINSCLRPVCSLGGLAVTTIEGTGATRTPPHSYLAFNHSSSRHGVLGVSRPTEPWLKRRAELAAQRDEHHQDNVSSGAATGASVGHSDSVNDGMNPVAYRLAANNGTQCGYCTTGFVMNMSAFLAQNPNRTKREIEDALDGNICRCTGYRPILTGLKTFASDWSAEDEDRRMKCKVEDAAHHQLTSSAVTIPLPDEAKAREHPVTVTTAGKTWLTPESLDELVSVMRAHRDKTTRIVLANTAFGVYKDEYLDAEVIVDIRLVPDIHGLTRGSEGLTVGAATTYTDFIDFLAAGDEADLSVAKSAAMLFMARRTGGTVLRNAASLAGNTMLVLHHITASGSDPFPSDLFTTLLAIDAEVDYLQLSTGRRQRSRLEDLMQGVIAGHVHPGDLLLLRYLIGTDDANEVVLPQKVALRSVNAHTIVNATTRYRFSDGSNLASADLIFGGIAPHAWRAAKTEAAMVGRRLSLEDFPKLAAILRAEALAELERWSVRMAGLTDEGISAAYRIDLVLSFFYKSIISALVQRDPGSVPEGLRSIAANTWGTWDVSSGEQHWQSQGWKAPVSQPYIKLKAMSQAMGEVHYTHEIALPPNGINAALVQSRRALAEFHYTPPGQPGRTATLDEVEDDLRQRFDGFIRLIDHRHVPGFNLQGMGGDQPLFAESRVHYVGQSIAMVLADTEQQAIRIAEFVGRNAIGYRKVDEPSPWNSPILSIDDAIRRGSIFPDAPKSANFNTHIWRIERPGSRFDWANQTKDPLDRQIVQRSVTVEGIPCLSVENTQSTGGQIHFYMETQAAVALPEDGGRLIVHPSSQSPMEMHQTTASALGVEYNRVQMEVRQLGGGFGGKTEQARFVVGPVAVAAHATGLPVRMAMEREADTALVGKRHPYYGQYQIAVDTGELDPESRGIVRGFVNNMWGDGGVFYDCSFVVSNSIQLRADNAYLVKNFRNQIDVCRTNKAPNTAFRSFGDVQAKIITESAYDDAAAALGMDPADLREKNMYRQGDVTPFGQALPDCYMREVWAFLKEKCDYDRKKAEVEAWNQTNRWRKRAVHMMPVKYGSGYNLVQLEQAMAMISVYAGDGSIVIHQGGVDMGQGAHTIAAQIAAYVLNLPLEMLRIEHPKTHIIPNPSSTGASTGTTYNGEAVRRLCQSFRKRMLDFGYQLREEHGDDWCMAQKVDFWNYPADGWAHNVSPDGSPKRLIWQNLVTFAYQYRIALTESFSAPIRGGETPVPWMIFKPMDQQPNIPDIPPDGSITSNKGIVDSFSGFTYSAACSVVEVDILTGETKILSSDIVYDMGWSLNPAIDIGQVEGAFVQGIGYVLTEQLVYETEGEEAGRLNTLNTWRYKPPAVPTIPITMNTWLFPRDLAPNAAENPNDLFSSKDVGEPPLVLAASVFLAVKQAVRASRIERGLSPLFRMDAPATVQEVRRAAEVTLADMVPQA